MFINIQLKLLACLKNAVVDFVQVKVAKDYHTLTMNLVTHIMKMHEIKEKCFH